MKTPHLLTLLASLCLFASGAPAWAEQAEEAKQSSVSQEAQQPFLEVAAPFGDAMVLQCDMPVPIWGLADPKAQITVSFAGQAQSAVADDEGRWMVRLDALKASDEERTLVIACGKRSLEIKRVLVGEVWICAGQSNMEMGIYMCDDVAGTVAKANDPLLRVRAINKVSSPVPMETMPTASPWLPDSEAALRSGAWGGFSASAYFFAKELRRQLKVPVGVVQSAWGGTRIEPWTPPQEFKQKYATWKKEADKSYRDLVAKNHGALEKFVKETQAALANHRSLPMPPPTIAYPTHGSPSAENNLFNGHIYPLIPYAMRGALWYQGESNLITGDGANYEGKMQALVKGWRAAWGEGDFPFYFVQIAPFHYQLPAQRLPELWEAQTKAASSIPNAGMAVVNDIGAFGDIHPKNKQEVGRRLALLALEKTYQVKVPASTGPQFKEAKVQGGQMRLQFDHAQGGIKARDGKPLTGFELAGADGVFVSAQARVEGDVVVLECAKVPAPTQARYAWDQCPVCNAANGEGLPMNAFRTSSK